MSISRDVNELNQLNTEIKRLSAQLKNLRTQAKAVNERIADYLHQKDQPGLRFQGQAIFLEDKSVRKPKKKSEREDAAILILRGYGIDNPEGVLTELLESRKGSPQKVQKLKIKNIQEY